MAIVDALLDDPERPALRALDANPTLPDGAGTVGGFTVLRGYSLLRGDQPPEDGLAHADLLRALTPVITPLDGSTPHVISLHRVSGLDGIALKCWLDGERSEALCEAAAGFGWPTGMSWELKQTYVFAPEG